MFSTPGPITPISSLPHTYSFTAPLFPEHLQLLLNLSVRTAVLLRLSEDESISLLHSQLFTPSGAKIFLALLQTYPKHCEFTHLFACLDLPQPEAKPLYSRKRRTDWELAIRPVRRAIAALAPLLPGFGLQTISLRNKGYLLAFDANTFPVFSPASEIIQVKDEADIPCDARRPLQRKLSEQAKHIL